VHFQVEWDYGSPVFAPMPDVIFENGHPLPAGNLNDVLDFGGTCLDYTFQAQPPAGFDPPPQWTPPVGGGNSMTLVLAIEFAGQPFDGMTNELAGFVDGVLAGRAAPQLIDDKILYFIHLTDVGAGEIVWQFYDANQEYLYQQVSGIAFLPYGSVGDLIDPLVLEFAPFEMTLTPDGQWFTNWLDTAWSGSIPVRFFAEDCEYSDKNDSTEVLFHFNRCGVGSNYWTGFGDGLNWTDAQNWSKGFVPVFCENILLPSANNVVIENGKMGTGKTLDVKLGATLHVKLGAELEVGW
jgi:hypothetical protein